MFPFTFKGKTYLRCTADESVNAKEWCATEVDAQGEVITGQWGDCDFNNIKCFSLGGGPAAGASSAQPQRVSRPPPQRPAPRQRLVLPVMTISFVIYGLYIMYGSRLCDPASGRLRVSKRDPF